MDDGNPIPEIIIIFGLILINAIVSSAKAAFDNVNDTGVKKRAENGDKKSKSLLKLLDTPNKYTNVFEIFISFTGVMIGMAYFTKFLNRVEYIILNGQFKDYNQYIRPITFVVFTFLLIFLIALFGTILPKKFAIKHAESIAYKSVSIMKFLMFILTPMNYLLETSMFVILRIFGIKPSELQENVTEEELISMVNEGQEQGVFDAGEAEMIANIIEMDEKEAQDIMTPKKKIVAVPAEITIEEALRFMLSENYSRYPLYEENRDNIIGILHLKDVINAYISEELKHKPLKEIAREPYFIPDTQNINILFHDMQSKNIHMAIAIDEYGQTAGLVAMEDILEEIVGNIQDEYDEEEKMIISKEKEIFIVKGSISLDELEDELGTNFEIEDFETLNGLLISLLDRIPSDGEKATLEFKGYQFEILETLNKMIEQVRISRIIVNEEMEKEKEPD